MLRAANTEGIPSEASMTLYYRNSRIYHLKYPQVTLL